MANVDSPNGLAPVRYSNGAPWNGQCTLYVIPASDTSQYGIGDIVFSKAGSDAKGVPYIQKAVAASVPRGVIVGVDPVLTNGLSIQGTSLALETIAIPATKAKDYYVYVADDPAIIFEAQANNSTTLTAANVIGKNVLPVIANPATGSPFSGTELDSTAFATTSTHMLKVLGLAQRPGLDFSANAKLLVRFNAHEFFGLTTGAS